MEYVPCKLAQMGPNPNSQPWHRMRASCGSHHFPLCQRDLRTLGSFTGGGEIRYVLVGLSTFRIVLFLSTYCLDSWTFDDFILDLEFWRVFFSFFSLDVLPRPLLAEPHLLCSFCGRCTLLDDGTMALGLFHLLPSPSPFYQKKKLYQSYQRS